MGDRTADTPRSRHGFLQHRRPRAFAHRGGTEVAPENSIAAFASAVGLGYRYLETDVHLTADGIVVAAHDERLDRVADVDGAIAEMAWRDVAAARLGGSEPIPTFEELLVEFPEVCFNIDPKSDLVVEPLADLLVRHDALDRVCIGTFSDARLQRIRERFGAELCTAAGPRETARLMAASRLPAPGASERPSSGYQCVQVPVKHKGVPVVTRRFVDRAHRMGVEVHVWTIDEPDVMHGLLDLGVDGIMTDRPGVLREVLGSRGEW